MKTNMEKLILLRYGELHLKGRNRGWFERVLIENIKTALSGLEYKFERTQGRYFIYDYADAVEPQILARLKKVIGLRSYSIAYKIKTDWKGIMDACLSLAPEAGAFKVECNRADKTFAYKTPQITAEAGFHILESNGKLKVDLHNPDTVINIDIRENGSTYIFGERVSLSGGLPVGTGGGGMVLLSGGIDSPVAAYLMAKRGLSIKAVHFQSYPYTSVSAQEKVIELSVKLKEYCGGIGLFMVPFKEIQDAIRKSCPENYMITIMRRFMMLIAEKMALRHKCDCLITGESLGQVASQTVESITVTGSAVSSLPVFRPLIGMDKEEIIKTAKNIGTYDISIKPYDDCCTVFLPQNPVIRPDLKTALSYEAHMDVEGLVNTAIENTELIKV